MAVAMDPIVTVSRHTRADNSMKDPTGNRYSRFLWESRWVGKFTGPEAGVTSYFGANGPGRLAGV